MAAERWGHCLRRRKGIRAEVPIFSRQVTGLASLLVCWIARGDFTTLVWILMGACCGTVAVLWDWFLMDVIHYNHQQVKTVHVRGFQTY